MQWMLFQRIYEPFHFHFMPSVYVFLINSWPPYKLSSDLVYFAQHSCFSEDRRAVFTTDVLVIGSTRVLCHFKQTCFPFCFKEGWMLRFPSAPLWNQRWSSCWVMSSCVSGELQPPRIDDSIKKHTLRNVLGLFSLSALGLRVTLHFKFI